MEGIGDVFLGEIMREFVGWCRGCRGFKLCENECFCVKGSTFEELDNGKLVWRC